MKQKVLFALVILSLFIRPAPADDVWTPEKMMLEHNPGSTAISPNNRWVAYVVTTAVMEEEKSEYLTHIWISAADGSRSYQLTRGDKSCTEPAWSPSGKWVAFLSERSGKKNIWLIRPDGGEAVRLTDVETGVGGFAWSPNGKEIAFLMTNPETEEEKKAKKAKDDARVVDTNFSFAHLYRVKAAPPSGEYPEPVRVTEGEFHVTGFDWSPDGTTFVISHQTTPLVDDWRTGDVSTVPAEGGELKPLVRDDGYDAQPLFSPDGRTVAYVSDLGNLSWARHWRICLIPAAGGDVELLQDTLDSRPFLIEWAPRGDGIYFTESYRTNRNLFFYYLQACGSAIMINYLKPGAWGSFDISRDGTLLSFTREDLDSPEEVYVLPARSGRAEPLRISDVNGHLPDLPLARSEVIKWESFDGKEIEAILHYPLKYEEGKKYPLLLNIHGGPAGAFARTFTAGRSIYPLQALAARGFLILQPNPRGSSGYGAGFRFANIRDWGGGDYSDLMAGVDYLIEKGIADPERLGVMGWSYGGYMTSWIITQTDRFQAAAVGAGVTNLFSFTGTTDIVGFIPSYFEAELWEDDAVYRAHSAMFHIGNAVTPTLILHGENDARVPISQGYELYHALKRKGVDVRMVVYPRTPHGPREPKLLLDVMNRHLEWFSERLLEEK